MQTLLEIPLREIVPTVIQEWQSKFPNATLKLERSENLIEKTGAEENFWTIIDHSDWKKSDSAAVAAPAILALSKMSRAEIEQFHSILHEKLYALDGLRFAVQLGSNRFTRDDSNHFSVDIFLYSRCAVVANGRNFYETVLANPR
jgi:hypothetical protein